MSNQESNQPVETSNVEQPDFSFEEQALVDGLNALSKAWETLNPKTNYIILFVGRDFPDAKGTRISGEVFADRKFIQYTKNRLNNIIL